MIKYEMSWCCVCFKHFKIRLFKIELKFIKSQIDQPGADKLQIKIKINF